MTDRDRYDRLLRYAWLDFGDGEVYLVNEAMARAGYAVQSTFPPDVKYEPQIREATVFAREQGFGLWSACQTDAEGDTNELSGTRGIVVAPDAPSAPGRAAPEPLAPAGGDFDPSYPSVCIPPSWASGDLDCGHIAPRHFTVLPPDSLSFDGDYDGIGCER